MLVSTFLPGVLARPVTRRSKSFIAMPGAWIRAVGQRIARHLAERRGLAELAACDDRMLRDIGLIRSQLHVQRHDWPRHMMLEQFPRR